MITGLPAKYRDSQTMLPVANLDAYQELKRRLDHNELYGSSSTGKRKTRTSTSSINLPGSTRHTPRSNPNSKNIENMIEDENEMIIIDE